MDGRTQRESQVDRDRDRDIARDRDKRIGRETKREPGVRVLWELTRPETYLDGRTQAGLFLLAGEGIINSFPIL